MNPPRPAILAQSAVRRLPRGVLWLLCLAYILPGFIGRDPWRSADITGFGTMWAMAQGHLTWLGVAGSDALRGLPPIGLSTQIDALLPYWLGAGAIHTLGWLVPSLPADAAARWPFVALLALVLISTWYAVYGLARTPQAQPVMFALGGEAQPVDYARAMADAGLLALLACLGLALMAHETAPALAQLAFTALSYCAVVQLMRGKRWAVWPLLIGLPALALSGAPTVALLFGAGSALIAAWGQTLDAPAHSSPGYVDSAHAALAVRKVQPPGALALWIGLCTLVACTLTLGFDLWRWRIQPLSSDFQHYKGMARLLLWFGWPAMPLALWTVWRWRQLWYSPHLALPMWFLLVALLSGLSTSMAERSLLLGLPALATLAAFALPTLRRSVSALIDWFTLLFFSGWALVVWVVWFAMQTGIPAKPAANMARIAPGFVPELSWPWLVVAIGATVAWLALVRWRVGRHQAAIWKSLVLPAGGATLGWVLVMSLLISPLNYALSNTRLVSQIKELTLHNSIAESPCFEVRGLSAGLVTALRYHGQLKLADRGSHCAWLLTAEALIADEVFGTNALPDSPAPADTAPAVGTEATVPTSPPLPPEAKLWTPVGAPLYGPRGGEGVRVYRRRL